MPAEDREVQVLREIGKFILKDKKMLHFVLMLTLMVSTIGCKSPESEIYLIPQGFTGKVNIIFNQPKGAAPKYEEGERVYQIPANGILLTQFNDEYGLVDRQYFYADSSNRRTPLRKLKDDDFNDSTANNRRDEIGIFYDGTSGVYGNSADPKALHYQEFTVSDFNSLDGFFKPEYQAEFKRKLKEVTRYEF